MSTFDSDDLERTGYFLPEDSQFRLKKLREYLEFLSHLAQPRIADEEREGVPEIRPGEVAICLELLEEQIAQVLGELSWPAKRGETAAAGEADADAKACTQAEQPEVAGPLMDEAGNRLLAGVTLDQIDEVNLLLSSLRALGNVVTCSDHAELSDVTLSIMGDAIVRDVEKLRDIMRDVQGQTLKSPHATKTGVREEWATYVLPPCLPMGSVPPIVGQLPTYQ
ncbi:XAC0095 family protein [Rhodanobacter umsongensis]|uniref:XAC0095 family protein n=1 Tax=Rhodanobacter umsongensis TaxID=633153 RepID=A0ABW0JKR6_9GAMM